MRRNRNSCFFEAIFARDRGLCVYCGVPVLRPGLGLHRASDRATLDHLIPKSQGGALTENNVVLACQACNNERGTLDAEAFRAHKLSTPDSCCQDQAKKKAPQGSLLKGTGPWGQKWPVTDT